MAIFPMSGVLRGFAPAACEEATEKAEHTRAYVIPPEVYPL